ncbi:hypothetical protein ACHHRT_11560 [Desulfurivibrio sp. D14AmB]|uniref:hypothetical protein n=1 Tax=Desulfurivibrio sp. D14AmB TaxID=3374370 RepID=UPI00376F0F49
MGEGSKLQQPGEKVRRAIAWVAECLSDNPEKDRCVLIREAEIRFDLSPAECDFLDRNFRVNRTPETFS